MAHVPSLKELGRQMFEAGWQPVQTFESADQSIHVYARRPLAEHGWLPVITTVHEAGQTRLAILLILATQLLPDRAGTRGVWQLEPHLRSGVFDSAEAVLDFLRQQPAND